MEVVAIDQPYSEIPSILGQYTKALFLARGIHATVSGFGVAVVPQRPTGAAYVEYCGHVSVRKM